MAEFFRFAGMTEWMIGWVSVGGFSIVKFTRQVHSSPALKTARLLYLNRLIRIQEIAPSALGVFIAWCLCGVFHLILPNEYLSLLLMVGLAFWTVSSTKNNRVQTDRKEVTSPESIHSRLIQLRLQLQRLHEKERLSLRLEKAEQSQMVLDRYDQRFHVILIAIENHLTFGDHDRAERIITLFSRHLRHILYEGSVPFLTLETTIDHIKTHLNLMELLTAGRFNCDIDDGMLEPSHLARCTESLRISPWVESMVWPFFQWAERNMETIDPMQLFLDVEEGEIILSCVHPSLEESDISNTKRLTLLGDYADVSEDSGEESQLKVVA